MSYKITFRGTGQLNGPIPINKTVEYNEYAGKLFLGSQRDEVIIEALSAFYPGVEINPSKIGLEVIPIKSKKKPSTKKKKENSKSIFRKPYIFIPFRLLFKLLGYIWRTTLKE